MNFYVVVEKLCRCAQERRMEQIRAFGTQEEAREHAYEWADVLNNTFCGRHGFDVVEVNGSYVIAVQTGGYVESCECPV
jgi:hypothetical protein